MKTFNKAQAQIVLGVPGAFQKKQVERAEKMLKKAEWHDIWRVWYPISGISYNFPRYIQRRYCRHSDIPLSIFPK